MYLAITSRPDIPFAIHQCAHVTHLPHQSQSKASKNVLRYIKGTEDERVIIELSQNIQVDCYVDADFFSLWGVEEDQKPLCIKSCTVFIIMFMRCHITWVSKLKYQNSLSNMEA